MSANGKRVLLTDKGRKEVTDYLSVVEFIGEKLIKYWQYAERISVRRSNRRGLFARRREQKRSIGVCKIENGGVIWIKN